MDNLAPLILPQTAEQTLVRVEAILTRATALGNLCIDKKKPGPETTDALMEFIQDALQVIQSRDAGTTRRTT